MLSNHSENGFRPLVTKHISAARKSIRSNWDLYLLILPVLAYFIIFYYWPIYGVQIAFKRFSPVLGISGSPWAGFVHFERFFKSYYFGRLIKNTVGISAYSIIIGIPVPVILAIMFNELRSQHYRSFVQTISYAPNFLSMVVLVGMVLFFLSPSNGVINALLSRFGLERINFIAKPKLFWHIYVWSGVWQTVGWGSIIYTAAISGIPQEQYEAAVIDGASRIRCIAHVTIPGIMPTVIIISILSIGSIMAVGFEKIFLLQNSMNVSASEVISTYVYKSGIEGAQFSFSAAVGLFNNLVNFVILAAVNGIARRLGEISLW